MTLHASIVFSRGSCNSNKKSYVVDVSFNMAWYACITSYNIAFIENDNYTHICQRFLIMSIFYAPPSSLMDSNVSPN